jgi:hypothetical protein
MFSELKPILDKLGIFLDYMSDAYDSEDKEYFKENPKAAFMFAKSVLNGPFPEAEEVILKDPFWGKLYKEEILQKSLK